MQFFDLRPCLWNLTCPGTPKIEKFKEAQKKSYENCLWYRLLV